MDDGGVQAQVGCIVGYDSEDGGEEGIFVEGHGEEGVDGDDSAHGVAEKNGFYGRYVRWMRYLDGIDLFRVPIVNTIQSHSKGQYDSRERLGIWGGWGGPFTQGGDTIDETALRFEDKVVYD
jgi:hypothetical protein